jgi:hypothetical protein
MNNAAATDTTRNSLIDAISTKVEPLDRDSVCIYRHGVFIRSCSHDSASGYIDNLVRRGYGKVSECEIR